MAKKEIKVTKKTFNEKVSEGFVNLTFKGNKKRENVEIKTAFKDIKDFQKNGRDVKGESEFIRNTAVGEITGEIKKAGTFELSSTKRVSSIYKYVGQAEEREDAVYLVGDIVPKSLSGSKLLLNASLIALVSIMFAAWMVNNGYNKNLWFVFLLFMAMPVVQLSRIITDNNLYKDMMRKFSNNNQ